MMIEFDDNNEPEKITSRLRAFEEKLKSQYEVELIGPETCYNNDSLLLFQIHINKGEVSSTDSMIRHIR